LLSPGHIFAAPEILPGVTGAALCNSTALQTGVALAHVLLAVTHILPVIPPLMAELVMLTVKLLEF
jgi:hypothetical protein